jgi:nitroreductase
MSAYAFYNWERLMNAADAAPSVFNTRPWLFERVAEDRIELRADWSRHLTVTDPRHRELMISCGAALFNLRLAIRVTGHDPVIWLLPDELQAAADAGCPHCGLRCGVGDLLASVEIVLHRTHPVLAAEQRLYEAIPRRHTVREPFSSGLPMNVLGELEQAARREGAVAHLLFPPQRKVLLRKAAAIDAELKNDTGYRAEVAMWTHDGERELGIASSSFGPRPADPARSPVRDFGLGREDSRQVRKFEKDPQFIALETMTDKPSDWLRLGQALQRMLLTATSFGVQTSFLTHPLEMADRAKAAEQKGIWPWPRSTQMVIRVGRA